MLFPRLILVKDVMICNFTMKLIFSKLLAPIMIKMTLALIYEVKSTDFVDLNKKEKFKFKLLANISTN